MTKFICKEMVEKMSSDNTGNEVRSFLAGLWQMSKTYGDLDAGIVGWMEINIRLAIASLEVIGDDHAPLLISLVFEWLNDAYEDVCKHVQIMNSVLTVTERDNLLHSYESLAQKYDDNNETDVHYAAVAVCEVLCNEETSDDVLGAIDEFHEVLRGTYQDKPVAVEHT